MALLSAKITTPAQIAQTGGTIPATVKSVKITQPQTTGIVLQSGTTGPAGPTGPAGSTGITGTVRGLYNAGTTYTAGPPPDVVLGSNGHWYVSLTNANIGHDPTTDGGVHWADELPSLVVTSTTALNAVSGLVQVVNATDAAYGAKADAQQATGSITATQNTLTITAGSIPAVGQFVMVPGAGTTGGGVGGPFSAYVSSVASNVVTLVTTRGGGVAANAGTTSTGATVTFGTGCAAAVNTALAVGKRVHFPAGSYVWDTPITPSSLYLTGDGVGRTIIYFPTNISAITVTGPGLTGSTGALTANAVAGAQSLTVGGGVPAGIGQGDYIYISSTTVFDAAESFCTCGEFARVYGISGTTVYLNSPLVGPFTYTTAATAKIQKMSFLEGVHVGDMEWISGTPEKSLTGPTTPAVVVNNAGAGNVIQVKRAAWPTLENLKVTGWSGDFIGLTNCVHFRCQNIDGVAGAEAPALTAGNSYGYKISAYGSQWGEVLGGVIERSHGGFNAEGTGQVVGDIIMPTNSIEVRGATSRNGTSEPFLCHNASAFVDFIDCKLMGGPLFPPENTHDSGFQLVGKYCRAISPVISNTSGRTILLANDHCEAINPVIRNLAPWNDRCDGISVTGTNCRVVSADIDGVPTDPSTGNTGRGILVQAGATGFELAGQSTIRNTTRSAIEIQDTSNTERIYGITGINNTRYVIESFGTNPLGRWSNVLGINPGLGVTNKPGGIASVVNVAADRLTTLRQGTVTSYRESFDRRQGAGIGFTVTSGTVLGAILPVLAGDSFTKIAFRVFTTAATFAANNDGHWWLAVYDNTGTLIVQTADQGITALTANSNQDIALQSTYTPAADALVRASLMIYLGTGAGAVAPTLNSSSAPSGGANFVTGLALQAVSGTAGLTSGTAPGTFGATTALGNIPYLALHN
jgi:hypothetical protein